MAEANTRRAEFEAACTQLTAEIDRTAYLHEQHRRLANEVRRTIGDLARCERAGGHSAVRLVLVLHDVVNEAVPDRAARRAVEPTVVECGIDSYFAA